jgi:hypothetical protein
VALDVPWSGLVWRHGLSGAVLALAYRPCRGQAINSAPRRAPMPGTLTMVSVFWSWRNRSSMSASTRVISASRSMTARARVYVQAAVDFYTTHLGLTFRSNPASAIAENLPCSLYGLVDDTSPTRLPPPAEAAPSTGTWAYQVGRPSISVPARASERLGETDRWCVRGRMVTISPTMGVRVRLCDLSAVVPRQSESSAARPVGISTRMSAGAPATFSVSSGASAASSTSSHAESLSREDRGPLGRGVRRLPDGICRFRR